MAQPTTIQRLAAGVPHAMAMLAAMELDVFTPLKDGPLTAEQLAGELGVTAAKLQPVLAMLVTAGLLTADGERFANTEEAAQHLVRGRPAYMGSVYELWADLWGALLKTAQSVRTATPQAKHDFAAMSPEALRAFVRGSHAGSVAAARALMAARDLSPHRALLDVGGGSGGLAITLAEAFAHLRATVIELPLVAPLTREFIAEASASERLHVLAGDVVRDALGGPYDVAVCNRFLQVLPAEEARRTLDNLAGALSAGGWLHIIGHVLDDSGLSPPAAVGFGLLAVNLYEGGRAFTEREHREWLGAAGFVDIARAMLPNGYSLLSARKRS
jgi:cyclopropane fatty-acyl-phospholipid synthase-like methyltransferase